MKPDEVSFEKSAISDEAVENTANDLNDKQLAYVLMRKQGLDVQKASKLAGYHPRTGYILERKLRKFDLTEGFWLSKAQKALKNILEGKPWGSIEQIKDSTALEASKVIFDRAQPVIRKNLNMNMDAKIDLVDLSAYANKREPTSIYDIKDDR